MSGQENEPAKALAQLDKNIRFRGKAAKLGAEAGECLREWKISRAFREEAFWSESNLENLLFMLNGSYNEETYQELLEKEIISRMDAVVGGGYRTSYVKAAELVVTLDEIMEEKGICPGGVTRERIRSLHSRKSAFKQELDALK